MNILITGGAGFIGSNFIPFFLKNNPSYSVINLDLLTYAGDLNNLLEVENNPRYTFIKGSICDEILLRKTTISSNNSFFHGSISGAILFTLLILTGGNISSPFPN